MFSGLFARTRCSPDKNDGGPTGHSLFELKHVGIETVCLLFSSYTCGLGSLFIERGSLKLFYALFALTFVLGAIFLSLEFSEFAGMVAQGAGPSRSAFLSSFFSLVGMHGAHVTVGLLWLAFMMAQVAARGPRELRAAPDSLLQPFLARTRHHLGGGDVPGLLDGSTNMTDSVRHSSATDLAPGDRQSRSAGIAVYTVGLAFALLLTAASFIVSQTHLLWAPGVSVGLAVLAIAQMGVHLVFFLHINSGPDNTNNVLALAFGILIVTLVVSGSLWIMANLNGNMMPHSVLMEMQR